MKVNEFLNQYFSAYVEELKNKHPNIDKEDLKDIFLFSFKEGFTFNSEIITDLNDEILEIKNKKRELPTKLKDFLEHEWPLTI